MSFTVSVYQIHKQHVYQIIIKFLNYVNIFFKIIFILNSKNMDHKAQFWEDSRIYDRKSIYIFGLNTKKNFNYAKS